MSTRLAIEVGSRFDHSTSRKLTAVLTEAAIKVSDHLVAELCFADRVGVAVSAEIKGLLTGESAEIVGGPSVRNAGEESRQAFRDFATAPSRRAECASTRSRPVRGDAAGLHIEDQGDPP